VAWVSGQFLRLLKSRDLAEFFNKAALAYWGGVTSLAHKRVGCIVVPTTGLIG